MCHESEVFFKEKGGNALAAQTEENYTGIPKVSKPFALWFVGWQEI
jgi:hypothetical protein